MQVTNIQLQPWLSFVYMYTKFSRTRIIRHRLIRLIRHLFVGPGRLPIFCVHSCSSKSSICL